jgi:hypothetical protein
MAASRSNAEISVAAPEITPKAVMAPVVGFFVPGGGHFIQKKWGRGALLMVSIVSMFVLGLLMEGKLYSFNTGDILEILGFFGDIGSGGLYIVSKLMDLGQGNIARATADYGTKYLIVAGLLNIVAMADAWHIAIGKKQ